MSEPSPQVPRRKGRWRWAVLFGLLAAIFHVPILQGVGRYLCVDEPAGDADVVLIMGGDHRLQIAAELLAKEAADRVWLIRERPGYLETTHILPPGTQVAREELASLGVTAERIEVLEGTALDLSDRARILKAKLEEEPDVYVVALSGALSGRHLRMVFDEVLGEALASRVNIQPLPYDRFDVRRWWHSRSGLKSVFNEICTIGFTLATGTGPSPEPMPVDPDQWEQEITQQFGEAACHDF